MIWALFAIMDAMSHGFANILDNYFVNKIFKNIYTLFFYGTLIELAFLPLVFLIQIPDLPTINTLPFFVVLGLTNLLYLYPYYKALQHADTSVVASLFSLGKIFIPILAFFIVGEILTPIQYAGFFIVILSSALLTLEDYTKLKFNRSFFYMALTALILAFETVLFKYVFTKVTWSTGFTWSVVFSFVMIAPVLLFAAYRKSIIDQIRSLRANLHLFVAEELLTFGGNFFGTLAISLAPVTLVGAIFSTQPFFVLAYALIFSRFIPHVFREKMDKKNIFKKVILFIFVILGIILVLK